MSRLHLVLYLPSMGLYSLCLGLGNSVAYLLVPYVRFRVTSFLPSLSPVNGFHSAVSGRILF